MIAIVDFETGGVNPAQHAIVSVAVLLLDANLKEYDRFYTLVNDPGRPIEDQALAVNGLTREQIAAGMPVDEALFILQEMLADSKTANGNTFAGHNCAFDARIYNLRTGANVQLAIDTFRLSYRVWPYPAKARLINVCERLGIPVENAHNALGDVLMTAEALRRFASMSLEPAALLPQQIGWGWKPWQGS